MSVFIYGTITNAEITMLTDAPWLIACRAMPCNVWVYIFHRAVSNCISTRQNALVFMESTVLLPVFYVLSSMPTALCNRVVTWQ